MSNEIVTRNGNGVAKYVQPEPFIDITVLEKFTAKLNAKPQKVDKAQGYDTIPIDVIETELDEDYMGLWQTENFRWQVVANEIVGTIDLLVFHPVAKTWLRRTGSASTLIRQSSGADLTDISKKIKNGLVMDFPKLEIMCIKSAAKKLGEKYGRSLNRKILDSYEMIYTDEIEAQEAIDQIGEEMNKAKSVEDLLKIWAKYPDMQANSHFKKHFNSARQKLSLK